MSICKVGLFFPFVLENERT
uniref:Uncharacterized protein n=1 Tax=Anguilla anguilla TaxID=7936 RepID=A0A0E9QAX6_ANGAN